MEHLEVISLTVQEVFAKYCIFFLEIQISVDIQKSKMANNNGNMERLTKTEERYSISSYLDSSFNFYLTADVLDADLRAFRGKSNK